MFFFKLIVCIQHTGELKMKKMKKPQRILNCLIDWDQKQITKDASGKMTIKGYANTNDKDRVGDVVLPTAFAKTLKEYMENPVVLYQHDWDQVIGKCVKAEVTDDGLYVECEISGAKDVEDVKTKIAEGSLKTFSIGYNEIDADYDESKAANVVKELELLEISVVTIPCNPKAKFTTDVEEKKEEAKKDASTIDVGFFKFLADALVQLEKTDDIDGEFLQEIHGIYSKQKV
jgi:HK97 family phage prohead protease